MTKQKFRLTTLKVIIGDLEKFQAIAHERGTTGSALMRGFIIKTIAQAEAKSNRQ
jgi:hypothetical protein